MRKLVFIFALLVPTLALAQGSWSGTGTISGSGTVGTPSVGNVCQIVPPNLPAGVVGTPYTPVQMTYLYCAAPVVWSVSAGALPAGLTLSSSGLISGTPSAAGSASFTITLTDNLGRTPIYPSALSITSTSSAGTPLAPDSALTSWNTMMIATPTNNQTLCVGTPLNASILPGGGCVGTIYPGTTTGAQNALNAVACGQIINFANLQGLGALTIPNNKKCPNSAWIWLAFHDLSDPVFPPEGTRPDPSYIGIPQIVMPWYPYPGVNATPNTVGRHLSQIIVPASSNNPCLRLNVPSSGANTPSIGHWRIFGLDCTRDQSSDAVTALLDLNYQPAASGQDCALTGSGNSALPTNPVACQADQPDHIILERYVVHGDPQRQTVRAVSLGGGTFIANKDYYIYDILDTYAGGQGDAQSFSGGFGHGYTGVGDWIFQNGFSASSSEGQLFCGAFTEPKCPITNADGIPVSVIWNYPFFYKPEVWDTQRGFTLGQPIVNEGTSYPPAGDQEIIFNPSAFTIQQGGPSVALHNTWINDSAGGWDRFDTNAGSGSITIDTLPCTFTFTTTVGTTPVGNTVVVASATGFTVGSPILIVGAIAGGNYNGTITGISGTTFTISPNTGVSVASGTNVINPDCLPVIGGVPSSANGIIRKNPSHQVGAVPYQMQNIISYSYIACSGAGVPDPGCTVATTAGNHALLFTKIVIDGTLSNLGRNRSIPNTVTATVTTGAPTNAIFITPSAPDLQIQPSYSDNFGNVRNFSYVMNAGANFTSTSLTWKVDSITNGSNSVGQICAANAVPCTAPGTNDSTVVYVSPSSGGLGQHTISVTSAAGTTTSQVITVSQTSPVWGYDMKAITVKNMWEAKCVNRGLLENFLMENTWGSNGNGGGQDNSLLNQAINQTNQTNDGSGANVGYGPGNISDLNVTYGHIINSGNGFAVAALGQAKGIHRLSYSNILMENINGPQNGHGFLNPIYTVFLQYSGTAGTNVLGWTSASTPLADYFAATHITMVGGTATNPGVNSWLSIANNNAQFQLGPFSVTNSIFQIPGSIPFVNNNGETNDCGTNSSGKSESVAFLGTGYTPPTPCFSSYSLANNLLVDNTTPLSKFVTSTIWETPNSDPTLFRNFSAGDFRVVAGGQYDAGGAKAGTDGKALGADVAGILANDAIIRWGNSSPMTISTTSLPNATHGVAYSTTLAVSGGTGPYVWSVPGGIIPPGAMDVLDWALMPEPNRSSNCLNGASNPKCFVLQAGLIWWLKSFTGNPWDGEAFDGNYVKQWFTENIWGNAQSYKMYLTPVSLWKRYHRPGDDDVVYTPGPNKYLTTTNCGADGSPQIDNLGVRGELTGPFTDQLWQTNCIAAGGTLGTCSIPDNAPYLLAQKWIKCTANNILSCTNEEDYWWVQGYGQAQWCPKTLTGGVYVTGTCTNTMQVVSHAAVTPNFACGLPASPTSGLPAGTASTASPQMNLTDAGVLSGSPSAAGTSTFTVQVEDSVGHVAQRTLTLVVN